MAERAERCPRRGGHTGGLDGALEAVSVAPLIAAPVRQLIGAPAP